MVMKLCFFRFEIHRHLLKMHLIFVAGFFPQTVLALKGSWRLRGEDKEKHGSAAHFCDPSRTSGPSLRFRRGKKPGRFQVDCEKPMILTNFS